MLSTIKEPPDNILVEMVESGGATLGRGVSAKAQGPTGSQQITKLLTMRGGNASAQGACALVTAWDRSLDYAQRYTTAITSDEAGLAASRMLALGWQLITPVDVLQYCSCDEKHQPSTMNRNPNPEPTPRHSKPSQAILTACTPGKIQRHMQHQTSWQVRLM